MDVWKIFHPSNRESGYSVVKRGNPVRGLSECLRRKALSGFLLACFSSPRAIAPGNLAFRNLPLDFFRPPSFSPRSTRKLSAWRRRDFLIKFKWLWGEVKSIELFFSREVLFFLSCFGGNRFFKGIYVRIDVAEVGYVWLYLRLWRNF